MSKSRLRRPAHRHVLQLLGGLDRGFLEDAKCYFAGGTRIVLELGEYRESKDIDFLCSSQDGYRRLRETVSEQSLGAIVAGDLVLSREVRADQYGIRTFLASGEIKIKFEIVREARIVLDGEDVEGLAVACLGRKHCFAEKFLANADRGLDASTLSRDIVDLAFMIEGWPGSDAHEGLAMARDAYGDSIGRALAAVTRKIREDKAYRNRCVEGLAISDTKVMNAGLKTLGALA